MKPCDYDLALNTKLIRFNQIADVHAIVKRTHSLTEREKNICANSLMCELVQLKLEISKMCNGEDHQNEKQSPAKSR